MARLVRFFLVMTMGPLVLAALLSACDGDDGSSGGAHDPAVLGPYPVGVTEMTFQRKSSTSDDTRMLKTVIWYPADGSARNQPDDNVLKGVVDAKPTDEGPPLPVIMFSHGSGGMPFQSTYFTRHLASHGFVVVAPPHPGNTVYDCLPCTDAAALVDSFLNRPDDVLFVLDSVLKLNDDPDSPFYGVLDGERLGMSGHSFGGLATVMLASGQSRFDAALPMAPAGGERIPAESDDIHIPILIMGGGLDKTMPLEIQQDYFDSLPGEIPRYLLVLLRGGHLAYADICVPGLSACGEEGLDQDRGHEIVNLYATAFFKTYVAGETGYEKYLETAAAEGNPDIQFSAAVP